MGLKIGPHDWPSPSPRIPKTQNPIFVGDYRRTLWAAPLLRPWPAAALRPPTPSTTTYSPVLEHPATRYPTLRIHLSFRFEFICFSFFFSLSRYLVVLIAWCVGARLILRVLGEGVGEEADGGGVCRPPIPGGVQAGAGWIRQTVPLDLGNSFFFFLLACGCFNRETWKFCCFLL